jgi:EthR-like transcriptional regulator
VDASAGRIAAEVSSGASAARAPEATAFALVWMTERTLHQMLVQRGGTVSDDELVRALAGVWVATVYGR